MASTIIALIAGIALGMVSRINVTITHKNPEEPTSIEYNESTVSELDPEVRNYYDSTHGLNKF